MPLTVFQSLPVDGVIIVTTPQDLVGMIVAKAVNMAAMMNVPVLGLVENMSYYVCPDCGRQHEIFGKSQAENTAAAFQTSKSPIRRAFPSTRRSRRGWTRARSSSLTAPWSQASWTALKKNFL